MADITAQDTIEKVNAFLQGRDSMERIITMECDYQSNKVSIIYVNSKGEKRICFDDFKPFAWVKGSATSKLFNGDRKKISSAMRKYSIACKKLKTSINNTDASKENPRLSNGYKYMFYATKPMTYGTFLRFFEEAGTPLYEKIKKESKYQYFNVFKQRDNGYCSY